MAVKANQPETLAEWWEEHRSICRSMAGLAGDAPEDELDVVAQGIWTAGASVMLCRIAVALEKLDGVDPTVTAILETAHAEVNARLAECTGGRPLQ